MASYCSPPEIRLAILFELITSGFIHFKVKGITTQQPTYFVIFSKQSYDTLCVRDYSENITGWGGLFTRVRGHPDLAKTKRGGGHLQQTMI